ncbi:hypothetical protein HK098_001916 [Nowakowskiella sp. JEL0407]|nr:hypothetical protein HK098_001916 [Nowakowskiella sp. JEL0407]
MRRIHMIVEVEEFINIELSQINYKASLAISDLPLLNQTLSYDTGILSFSVHFSLNWRDLLRTQMLFILVLELLLKEHVERDILCVSVNSRGSIRILIYRGPRDSPFGIFQNPEATSIGKICCSQYLLNAAFENVAKPSCINKIPKITENTNLGVIALIHITRNPALLLCKLQGYLNFVAKLSVTRNNARTKEYKMILHFANVPLLDGDNQSNKLRPIFTHLPKIQRRENLFFTKEFESLDRHSFPSIISETLRNTYFLQFGIYLQLVLDAIDSFQQIPVESSVDLEDYGSDYFAINSNSNRVPVVCKKFLPWMPYTYPDPSEFPEIVNLLVGFNGKRLLKNSITNYGEYAEYATHFSRVLSLVNQRDDFGQSPLSLSYMIDATKTTVSRLTREIENLIDGMGKRSLNFKDGMFSTVYHTLAKEVLKQMVRSKKESDDFDEASTVMWYEDEYTDWIYTTVRLWNDAGFDLKAVDFDGMTGSDIFEKGLEALRASSEEYESLRDLVRKLRLIEITKVMDLDALHCDLNVD